MKKKIILCCFIIASSFSFSQVISYEFTEILIYSFEIEYSSSNGSYQSWSPNMNFYGNTLSQLQARYDRNHSILSKEYFKLKDLKLINTSNQSTLKNYKAERLPWIYNAIKSLDLGKESNTSKIRNYCCEIYSYPLIKYEIKLLQSCQSEINRIKYKDPDNYLYSKRYQAIIKTLDILKYCSPSEIKNLSWERIELENINMFSSNSNKISYNSTIGKPIKLGNIEIAQYNFPKKMNWYEAKKACEEIGNGWRLPTDDELWNMYLNRNIINECAYYYFWSSTEYPGSNYKDYVEGTFNYAIAVNFNTNILYDTRKTGELYVRAVRTL